MGLRWRETAVLSNFILYFLLLFAGVNVPLDLLPGWLQTLSKGLPITHGAEAAREIVAGSSIVDVAGLLGAEALVGTVYAVDRPRAAAPVRGHCAPARDARGRLTSSQAVAEPVDDG